VYLVDYLQRRDAAASARRLAGLVDRRDRTAQPPTWLTCYHNKYHVCDAGWTSQEEENATGMVTSNAGHYLGLRPKHFCHRRLCGHMLYLIFLLSHASLLLGAHQHKVAGMKINNLLLIINNYYNACQAKWQFCQQFLQVRCLKVLCHVCSCRPIIGTAMPVIKSSIFIKLKAQKIVWQALAMRGRPGLQPPETYISRACLEIHKPRAKDSIRNLEAEVPIIGSTDKGPGARVTKAEAFL